MFVDEVFVVKSTNPYRFALVEPVCYAGKHQTFTVPAGFVTDFATVPIMLTWFIPRYGVYTRAAIVHDYLCLHPGALTRRDADGIFRRMLRELKVTWPVRWMMWAGVRSASSMSNATGKEWIQFLLIAATAIPVLLIPTLVVGVWSLLFKILDYPFKNKENR